MQLRHDATLIKALARAHRWKQMLQSGEVNSVKALAALVKQERRYAGRTLNLAFLSPDLTRVMLHGEQPPDRGLAHLLEANVLISRSAQRAMIERLAGARVA